MSDQPSQTGEIEFVHVPIEVVPSIVDVPKFGGEETDGTEYTEISDVAGVEDFDFRETPGEFDSFGVQEVDTLTLEECKDVTVMIVNIPSMFGMGHLQRSEEQCAPFAKELHKYCEKKGLDPRDWFFDEFGMVMTGFGLIGGMYRDHKDHKREGKKNTPPSVDTGTGVQDSYTVVATPEPEEVPEERPDGAQMTTMIEGRDIIEEVGV